MILKKLELQGFKSFADKIDINFEQGITGIVGPNGSGKSNISDAVRWVLGEQNARQLRGLKMEDIIFNGTQARKPLSFCEVQLTFDNSDGALPMACSEVAVTRRVYRSGESEYYINRSSCRLKDIVELFQGTGIGQQGYSIIDQSQIKEIILSKPEDRREIFHEATGIVRFRSRRDESQRSLERTRQNMTRLGDIMGEMENQLEPLRQQSETARRYLQISEQLKQLETNRFLVVYEQLSHRIDRQRQRMEELQEISGEKDKNQQAYEQQASLLHAQAEQAETQVLAAQQETARLQQEISQRKTQRALLTEKLSHLREDSLRIAGEMDEEAQRAGLYREELAGLTQGLQGTAQHLDAHRQQISTLETELSALEERIAADETALESRKECLIDAMNRASSLKSSHARLSALRESVEKRLGELAVQLESLERDIAHNLAARQEISERVERLSGDCKSVQEDIIARQQQSRELTERLAQLNTQGQALRQQMQAARTRASMLQAMQKDYEGYGQAVKRLLTDAKTDSRLSSRVLGVVAELITVPKDYLTAVETALGPSMQHIVTPAEEDAQQLIAHLREQKYGRATFLPLSAIRASTLRPQEESLLGMKGCLGVASELVSYEPRFADVVGNLLGRTLIAQDMTCAIEMARRCHHSLRIVTLTGDIINPGGSMTGGSSSSRYTSIMGRQLELEECNRQYTALSDQAKALARDAEQLQKQGEVYQQTLAARTGEVHEVQLALARESQRGQEADTSLQRLHQSRTQVTAQQEQLTQQLNDIDNEIHSSRQDTDDLTRDDAALREELAAGQRRLAALREQREERLETLNTLRITLATGAQDQHAQQRSIDRLNDEIARIEEGLARRQTQIDENNLFIANRQNAPEDGNDGSDADDAALAGANQALAQAEEHRKNTYGLVSELERQQQEGLRALMTLNDELHQAEVDFTKATAELEALQNRMWEQYELTLAGAQAYRQQDFRLSAAEKSIESLRREVRQMGTVNVAAVDDYTQLKQRYDEYVRQRQDCERSAQDLNDIISQLNDQMVRQFREQFTLLNEYFSQAFTALFGGGNASLVLTDEDDVINSGVDIRAQPPGKARQMLSLFSDGEKSLIATALLFGMLKLRPSPFCILDEVEAALDEANLNHFAQYLKGYARSTQFVVVTHRKATMEAADRLYGVTMVEKGISKVITIKMSDYVENP